MLGSMLNTIHNLRHYQVLMAGLREAIQQGTLAAFVDAFYAKRGLLCRPWTEFSDPKIHYLQLEC